MTYLERKLEEQRAIVESQRGFMEAISKLLDEERARKKKAAFAKMQSDSFKQYAGQENCCPYGEGK